MKKIIIALCIAALVACGQIEKSERVQLSNSQVSDIKGTISNKMRNPQSAQFRNIRAVKNTYTDGSVGITVCGEVNGTNGFGGFTGFTEFTGTIRNNKFGFGAIAEGDFAVLAVLGTCSNI